MSDPNDPLFKAGKSGASEPSNMWRNQKDQFDAGREAARLADEQRRAIWNSQPDRPQSSAGSWSAGSWSSGSSAGPVGWSILGVIVFLFISGLLALAAVSDPFFGAGLKAIISYGAAYSAVTAILGGFVLWRITDRPPSPLGSAVYFVATYLAAFLTSAICLVPPISAYIFTGGINDWLLPTLIFGPVVSSFVLARMFQNSFDGLKGYGVALACTVGLLIVGLVVIFLSDMLEEVSQGRPLFY